MKDVSVSLCQSCCTTQYIAQFLIGIMSNQPTFLHTLNISSRCQIFYFACLLSTKYFFIKGIRFLILQSNKMFQLKPSFCFAFCSDRHVAAERKVLLSSTPGCFSIVRQLRVSFEHTNKHQHCGRNTEINNSEWKSRHTSPI